MFTRAAVVFLLMFTLGANAQQPSFTLTVDRTEVSLGQQFAVTYTFTGGDPNKLSDFRQPNLNRNFLVRSGPNQSSNIQIVNGKMSATLAFTFFVEPRKVGTFTVPAASIVYNGEKMTSNTASIKVVVGSRKPSQAKKEPKIDIGDAIFVRAFADKKNVYLGEQVTITYKLYTRVTVENYNVGKLPRMVGFWAEDFDLNPRRTSTVEAINGKRYRVFLLKKTALFPTQDGRLSVEPLKINVLIRVRQRRKTGDSFFDQFFNDPFFDRVQSHEVEIASNKLVINARPLPEKNKPASFHGAVGDFVMETKLDRDQVKANETITLTVKIRGKGNIKLLEPPELQVPNDVDHYDPRVEETITMGGGRMGGVKTFEYLLVPRYPGERIISPVEFSYYDLSSKRYVTLKSDSMVIKIEKGKTEDMGGVTDYSRKLVEFLNQDVKPIRNHSDFRTSGAEVPTMLIFLVMGFPVVGAVVLLLYKRRYDRIHGDLRMFRMMKATKIANRRLKRSLAYLNASQNQEFCLEISRALWGYVQDRLAVSQSELALETVEKTLEDRGVGEDAVRAMLTALQKTEYARYAPSGLQDTYLKELYELTKEAIVKVEEELSR